MGVRGLQTFLKKNPQLSERVYLNNTTLVIDANNLLCLLYSDMCLSKNSEYYRSDLYGGDMVGYADIARRFFQNLNKCGVVPILVFDGSVIGKQSTRDQLVLKEKTIYRRGLDKFEAAKNATEDATDDRINMPTGISHVFKNIVSDFGIQRIQTPYEADTHIARIANELGCPVLTNDSDFIIYVLQKGFIMLDLFDYKNPTSSKDGKLSIECKIFSQSRLINCLKGLRTENMALLSVLLGNDYIEAGAFDRILQNLLNNRHDGVFVTETFSHRRIASVLNWLKDKTLDEAIENIASQLKPDLRSNLERTIRILLKSYRVEETDKFEAEVEERYISSDTDLKNISPAKYLRQLMETSGLNAIALDVVFHNTYYNYPTIDDFQLPSSSFVKYRPLSVLVTLLRPRSYSNLTTYRRQIESEKDSFIIYDRIKNEYTKVIVRPIDYIEGFGSLELINCHNTISLEPALKKTLLMATFRFNAYEFNFITELLSQVFRDQFLHESRICLLLVKYIGLETKCNPKPQFVDSLMLTFFYYAALNGQLNESSFRDPSRYGKLLLHLRPHSIKNNGRKYNQSQALFRRIVHFISQLQSAYLSFNILNTVLNHVFQIPRYELFFNGTLIYRLTKLLRTEELNLETLCHGIQPLLDACGTVKVILHCD